MAVGPVHAAGGAECFGHGFFGGEAGGEGFGAAGVPVGGAAFGFGEELLGDMGGPFEHALEPVHCHYVYAHGDDHPPRVPRDRAYCPRIGRFTAKGASENLLARLTRAPLVEIDAELATIERDLAAHKQAYAIAGEHEFRSTGPARRERPLGSAWSGFGVNWSPELKGRGIWSDA